MKCVYEETLGGKPSISGVKQKIWRKVLSGRELER